METQTVKLTVPKEKIIRTQPYRSCLRNHIVRGGVRRILRAESGIVHQC
jgi:hypothetical protein